MLYAHILAARGQGKREYSRPLQHDFIPGNPVDLVVTIWHTYENAIGGIPGAGPISPQVKLSPVAPTSDALYSLGTAVVRLQNPSVVVRPDVMLVCAVNSGQGGWVPDIVVQDKAFPMLNMTIISPPLRECKEWRRWEAHAFKIEPMREESDALWGVMLRVRMQATTCSEDECHACAQPGDVVCAACRMRLGPSPAH